MNSFWTCCWKVSAEHVSFQSYAKKKIVFCFFSLVRLFFNYMVLPPMSESEEVVEFLEEVIVGLLSDQEVRTFQEVIVPVFDIFQGRLKDLDLCQPVLYSYLDVLLYFSHHKDIAKVRKHTQTM